ncbi:MAG: AEC family transporter [Coriobacteriales bacterium]
MFSIGGAMSSIVALLLITVLGYIAAKLGYLTDGNKNHIAKLLLNITLPCMIIASMAKMDASEGGAQIGWSIVLAVVLYFVLLGVTWVSNVVLRVPRGQRNLYLFMGTFANMGFVGIAVVAAVVGGGAAFLGSLFCAIQNVFLFSISTGILTSKRSERPGVRGRRSVDVKGLIKRIISAPLVASVIAMALFFTGTTLPGPIMQTLDMAGAVTAPLAMMLIGQAIAASNIREMVREWRLYGFTAIRMLVAPIVAWVVLGAMGVDPTVACVFTIMMTMPVGTMVPVLITVYGGDEQLATRGTVMTTVLSFATIPIVLALMSVL